jgi:hypothetical protein
MRPYRTQVKLDDSAKGASHDPFCTTMQAPHSNHYTQPLPSIFCRRAKPYPSDSPRCTTSSFDLFALSPDLGVLLPECCLATSTECRRRHGSDAKEAERVICTSRSLCGT